VQDTRKPTLDEVAERSFGLAMRAARNRLHLSQTALAAELERRHGIKLDGTAITRIERRIHGNEGARAIRLGEAVAIASILELSLDDLVEPGLDQQLRDARLRLDAAQVQAAAAQHAAAQAREHLEQLERMAEKHTRQVELEAELGVLQDEMYELRARIDEIRASDDQEELAGLIDRLLEMGVEETRLTTQLNDFVATP
jgi:chromosome segregation ATPase